jgi:GNAT superfamily N-acetyltransferase
MLNSGAMTASPLRVRLRAMLHRELPHIPAIVDTCTRWPWPERRLLRLLGRRDSGLTVAEADRQIIRFADYERCALETRVLGLAVTPEYRRRGVGGRLLSVQTAKGCDRIGARVALSALVSRCRRSCRAGGPPDRPGGPAVPAGGGLLRRRVVREGFGPREDTHLFHHIPGTQNPAG